MTPTDRPGKPRPYSAALSLMLLLVSPALSVLADEAAGPSRSVDGTTTAAPGTASNVFQTVEIDRQSHRFRVPARVIRLEPPLEYLAVAPKGLKAYEALLELDVGGIELNAACLLIGLGEPRSGVPAAQFDERPIEGDRVRLLISWEDGSGSHEVPAERLLTVDGMELAETEWVYLGSRFGQDGSYQAETTGSLIGFVHDPVSVIDNRLGLGIGDYGSVAGNTTLAPPLGTRVWLTVINSHPGAVTDHNATELPAR